MSRIDQHARFLAPGDKLGKYDLIRQIAVGGMAEIYLARTVGIEGFEKLVVVKRILPQHASDPSFVTMFLNEARLAATLQHPNITQVYDIGVEDGEYFFSMEYVHGEDLGRLTRAALDNGVPLSMDAALTLITGLCAGLHYAHDKTGPDGTPLSIVHRDVSPSNVLVSYDGAVKLVDFGIARAAGASTTGGLKGKIAYMSPEQCRGKVALDRRSDVFSVGTILYELTTGALPFTDETDYGVLNQLVNLDVPPPSKLVPSYPPALEKIVLRALARNPNERFATALELQSALEDFAHDNRLRVSPLVLARVMGSLFPARLEEWDHARAQGAFFVEQHVVRTLIESGKSDDDEETTVAQPPIQEPPIPGMPIPPQLTPPHMGVLVSTNAVPVEVAAKVGDVTERVRIPRRSGTIELSQRRSRAPVIILVASIAVAAGLVGFIVFRDDGTTASAKGLTQTPAPVVTADPPTTAPAVPPPAPSQAPAPIEPVVAETPPEPPVDKHAKKPP
ncbi:MAG TPA: serine/threonine-protein kinase, partial [Kofleriaceae bacterium]|nr:serine/threonine-protein kinase [Kofleriaceae bacterium]